MKIKIYKVNDYDWIAASSLDDAIKCLSEMLGDGIVDDKFKEEFIDDPHTLDSVAMDTMRFIDEDTPNSPGITFTDELNRRIGLKQDFPQHFATSEW